MKLKAKNPQVSKDKKQKMRKPNGITNNTLGVIIGLVVSIWWIFMGLEMGFPFGAPDPICYALTLGGYRHTIMTILALVLIPICARENKWDY
ncbi:hypothetical protein ES708_01086 [subsurface metagenome]